MYRYHAAYLTVHLMTRIRKGAVQIRFEILEFLFFNSKPQRRTYVWRKATSLSYDDFQKHWSYLKDKNLVKETSDGLCSLTPEGRRIYIELRKSLPAIL
ncbi:MAG: winged helix-turn-helix domain-containing protein [Candidatus Bathyarchaeia archaeon]